MQGLEITVLFVPMLLSIIHDDCLIYSNTVIRPNVIIHELTRIGSNCTITFGKEIKEGSDIKDGEVVI